MNYRARIKKQSTIIALVVICLAIATLGASYALFFHIEKNSANQLVQAGNLEVEYGSGSSAITTTEIMPMSDEDALASDTMTGTIRIENKGSLPAFYSVKLGDDTEAFAARENAKESDTLISHEYLRVAVYLNEQVVIEPTKLSDISYSSDDDTMHDLFTDYLNIASTGNNTATILLKVWLAEDAPASVSGQFVYLKMDVTSEVDERLKEETNQLTFISDGSNLKDYRIYGNSIQEGKNLIDSDSWSNLFEKQEDGSYLSNDIVRVTNTPIDFNMPAGTYTITVDIKCPIGKNYRPGVKNVNDESIYGYIDSTGDWVHFEYTFTSDVALKSFYWMYSSLSNEVQFKNLQIEEGSVATSYEPYLKPTPDNPVEIESVGVPTKNILDSYGFSTSGIGSPSSTRALSNSYGTTINTIDYENSVTITQSVTGTPSNPLSYTNGYFVIGLNNEPGDYILSFDYDIKDNPLNVSEFLLLNQGGGSSVSTQTLYLPNKTKGRASVELKYRYSDTNTTRRYLEFRCMGMSFTMSNIMLTKVGETTEYEPLGYKIPITASGKNLFKDSDVVMTDGIKYESGVATQTKADTRNGTQFKIQAINNTTFIRGLAADTVYNTGTHYFNFVKDETFNRVRLGLNGSTLDNTITIDASRLKNGTEYTISFKVLNRTQGSISWSHIQIEEGKKATSYESYVSPITKNIFLDEPLRKVGDYVDYIDFSNGKLIRNTRSIYLNVSDMDNSDNYPGWRYTNIVGEDLGLNIDLTFNQVTKHMHNVSASSQFRFNSKGPNGETTVYSVASTFGLTQTQWKTQYPNLKVNIIYGLLKPMQTKIDLPNIPTVDGTTILTLETTSPSKIEVVSN